MKIKKNQTNLIKSGNKENAPSLYHVNVSRNIWYDVFWGYKKVTTQVKMGWPNPDQLFLSISPEKIRKSLPWGKKFKQEEVCAKIQSDG